MGHRGRVGQFEEAQAQRLSVRLGQAEPLVRVDGVPPSLEMPLCDWVYKHARDVLPGVALRLQMAAPESRASSQDSSGPE